MQKEIMEQGDSVNRALNNGGRIESNTTVKLGGLDSNKNRLKFKQDNSMFVFGGDTQDRGIGDIRFVNILLNSFNI